ncbi:nitronate monooxygenase [Brevibacillus humidisoli]|uniref:NAD(P)H-dependent flavin oxidoreductase n=1 Tax=Brevibacillus humidisoli TaxID=2895522 RepID=UPI001E5F0B31|nr:nitronate monooxygenase [Brevibacillus humidisoli]UFJ40881.1 nitronate monooxygenase [Brevibacillus humidisoli]
MNCFYTRFCERFSLQVPIIQAGMAGGIVSSELVAAVSEAGGLGTLAGAYVKPDDLRRSIRRVKELTKQPFSVNLLLYEEPGAYAVTPELVDWLNGIRSELGLAPWDGEIPGSTDEVDECFSVILEEKVPVFSVAFALPGKYGSAAKAAGMKLIGMATTLDEAKALHAAGVDAIVAQGGEAGGHRGTFSVEGKPAGESVGTMALVPLLVDALPDTPIVAAGGIMDGRGLAAALSLGADAIQVGTRFLTCRESTAHVAYKERLLTAKETDPQITRAFSGRPARGIANRIMHRFAESGITALPYPVQNSLTREIRAAAARRNDAEYMSLWAGQGVAMVKEAGQSAAEIVEMYMAQAEEVVKRWR